MKSRFTEDTVALAGGALIGAAVLYLLDPESGRRRRARLASAAEGLYKDTRDRARNWMSHMGSVYDGASHTVENARSMAAQAHDIASDLTAKAAKYVRGHAGDAAHDFGKNAASMAHEHASALHDLGSHLQDLGSRLWSRAKGAVSSIPSFTSHQAGSLGDQLADQTDEYRKRAAGAISRASHRAQSWLGHDQSEGFGLGTILSSTVGCLALGAGAMYYFDPKNGAKRRAMLGDQISSCVKTTGETMRGIGGDVSHWLDGMGIHLGPTSLRLRLDSEQLLRDIREKVGDLTGANQIQFMTDADGSVTVTGEIASDQLDLLLDTLHGVRGVDHVINRLSVRPVGPGSEFSAKPSNAVM